MQINDEPYHHTAEGFQELWQFLVTTYALTGRPDNWLFDRLEDWVYGSNALHAREDPLFFGNHAHLWRDETGALVGFCLAEYADSSMFLQVHPQHRWVEEIMLEWLETVWARWKDSLAVYAFVYDTLRRNMLARRGYSDAGESGRTYRYDLAHAYPQERLPAGFHIAHMAEDRNVGSHIAAVREAFGRPSLNRAWFASKSSAPTYDPQWDLAVVSPEGEHVAFCMARLDRQNAVAVIDPIGTRPAYQRRGLAKGLLVDCFRRLQAHGMRVAFIGAGAEPAVGNRLYVSLQPAEILIEHEWRKPIVHRETKAHGM